MLYRNIAVFFCLLFAASLVMADDSSRHLQVEGMDVYLGVIPAQLTSEKMHNSATPKEHGYHILIALFDRKSGLRITDAKLKASVGLVGVTGSSKELEVMPGNALSYGNYFMMHQPERYRIVVEIKRKESNVKSTASFVYQRPKE